ncbi:hypothetical protein FRC07_005359 [Ceratobasidium sp. 392]|nr:hypothetical protein FRC07_005359 [Ceratobasidium sp. 392]
MSSRPSEPSASSSVVRRPAPSEPPREHAKRRKGLNAVSDAQAEKYEDKWVLADIRASWRSSAYNHYIPSVERHYDGYGIAIVSATGTVPVILSPLPQYAIVNGAL